MLNQFFAGLKFEYQTQEDNTVIITGYKGNDPEIEIPSEIRHMKVTGIGDNAFSGMKNLKKVTIPEGVTSIGECVFLGCESLTDVMIPGSVTHIGDHVFSDCINLKKLIIPDSTGVTYVLDWEKRATCSDWDGGNYVCPYCGQEISRDNILFWGTVKTRYKDDVRAEFLRCHGVRVEADNMFPRIYYKADINTNIVMEDPNGFPVMIEGSADHAVEPESLKKYPMKSHSKRFDDKRKAQPDSFDAFDDLFDSDDSFQIDDSNDPDEDFVFEDVFDSDSFDSDDLDIGDDRSGEKQNKGSLHIPLRACPFCHCDLPQSFGCIPTHHIAVYGGWASGKTAFLINLIKQLRTQLPENKLGYFMPEAESCHYLEAMTAYYERHGTTIPTPAEGIMPIVCHYRNKRNEAFYTFHEIPSEGMEDPEYLTDHADISKCGTLLLMIDPNMIADYGFYASSWDSNHGQNSEYCQMPLNRFLEEAHTWCERYADGIKVIIAVITKMDMVLELHEKCFSSGNIEITQDIGNKHHGAVDQGVIEHVGEDIQVYFEKMNHVNLKEELARTFGDDKKICILGTATSTKADGYGDSIRFEPADPFDSSRETPGKGHRIIEPFLQVLFYTGQVLSRDRDHRIVLHIGQNAGSSEYPPAVNQLLGETDDRLVAEQKVPETMAETSDDFDF